MRSVRRSGISGGVLTLVLCAGGAAVLVLLWLLRPGGHADPGTAPKARVEADGFDVLGIVLYQPDAVLQARVADVNELGAYITAIRESCSVSFAGAPRAEYLDVVVAVRPGRRSRVWFVAPDRLPDDTQLATVQRRLEALRAPIVVEGPVAFAILATLGGAKRERPEADGYRPPMPHEWASIASAHPPLKLPDDVLRHAWPESP